MRVYRLEYKHLKKTGPFAEYPVFGLYGAGVRGVSPEVVPPAEAAQYVAIALNQPRPYRFRPVRDDVQGSKRLRELTKFVRAADKRNVELVHGFASMDQYHEWFSTPEQRSALFRNMTFNREETVEYNDLELRCFEVPDDLVFSSDHQVLFSIDDAISSKEVKRAQAIA